jgi:hypothetical protein
VGGSPSSLAWTEEETYTVWTGARRRMCSEDMWHSNRSIGLDRFPAAAS